MPYGRTFPVAIGDVERDLPFRQVAPLVTAPVFNMLGDVAVVEAAATLLAPRIPPEADLIVTVETEAIPLAHVLAVKTGLPYVVLRRGYKPSMGLIVEAAVLSASTGQRLNLIVDEMDREVVAGKHAVLVEDVLSTRSTLQAMRRVVEQAGAVVVGEMVVFTEGDASKWPEVVSLGNLPVFVGSTE
jgi:adenine phosphoribosyltransferase